MSPSLGAGLALDIGLFPFDVLKEVQEVAEKLLYLTTIPQVVGRMRLGGA
jgi:hypothetical protein